MQEYISENNRVNLHPKLDKIYEKFPKLIQELKNLIFYGPSGTGKYSQMLKSIKKYNNNLLTKFYDLCYDSNQWKKWINYKRN